MRVTEPRFSAISQGILIGLEGRESQSARYFLIQQRGDKYAFRREMEVPWFFSKLVSQRSCFLRVGRGSPHLLWVFHNKQKKKGRFCPQSGFNPSLNPSEEIGAIRGSLCQNRFCLTESENKHLCSLPLLFH